MGAGGGSGHACPFQIYDFTPYGYVADHCRIHIRICHVISLLPTLLHLPLYSQWLGVIMVIFYLTWVAQEPTNLLAFSTSLKVSGTSALTNASRVVLIATGSLARTEARRSARITSHDRPSSNFSWRSESMAFFASWYGTFAAIVVGWSCNALQDIGGMFNGLFLREIDQR